MYVYIYIYRERDSYVYIYREREMYTYVYRYIYIYVVSIVCISKVATLKSQISKTPEGEDGRMWALTTRNTQ